MNYQEIKGRSFGSASVPDGYFGDRTLVNVALSEDGILYDIHASGCHRSPYLRMCFAGIEEAIYFIQNHPNGKKYYLNFKSI